MVDYIKIAANWANNINSYGVDPEALADAIAHQHKTLQQNFTKVCFAWLRLCASDKYSTDERNEASQKAAQAIINAGGEELLNPPLPYI